VAHDKQARPVIERLGQSRAASGDVVGLFGEELLFGRHALAALAQDLVAQLSDSLPRGGRHGQPPFPVQPLELAAKIGRNSDSRIPSISIVIPTSLPTTLPSFSIALFQLTPK